MFRLRDGLGQTEDLFGGGLSKKLRDAEAVDGEDSLAVLPHSGSDLGSRAAALATVSEPWVDLPDKGAADAMTDIAEGRTHRTESSSGDGDVAGTEPSDVDALGDYLPPSGPSITADVRTRMELLLHEDLSNVRISTGAESARAAERFNARAFTNAESIHFGAGEYAPGTKEGDRLLAHELTHVVQDQRAGVHGKAQPRDEAQPLGISDPGDRSEREADKTAEEIAARIHDGRSASTTERIVPAQPMTPTMGGGSTIRRAAKDDESKDNQTNDKAIKNVFQGKRSSPKWPAGFRPKVPPSITKHNIKEKKILADLREVERGDWKKVYEDGFLGASRVSIHYFQSPTGKVFDLKVLPNWSNV